MSFSVSIFVFFTRIGQQAHFVEILYCNKVSLKVIAEKFVVRSIAKNFLLFQIAHDELLHLAVSQNTITVELADLQEISSSILLQVILMLNHIKTCLKHPLIFLNMPNFNPTLREVNSLHLI